MVRPVRPKGTHSGCRRTCCDTAPRHWRWHVAWIVCPGGRTMLRPGLRVLCVSMLLVATACATSNDLRSDKQGVPRATKEIRRDAIARARVWSATNVAARDLRARPAGKGAVAPFADIRCDYIEKKLVGASSRFAC